MLSLSSAGLIGSWFFICATISFRKSSLPRTLGSLVLAVVAVAVVADVVVVAVVGSIAMSGSVGLGEDVDERAVRQLDRPVGDGKVGLGRVAGGACATVAPAVALIAVRGARAGAGRLVTGDADVDADDAQALLLERPAQLAGRQGEQVGGLGHLGHDAGAEALRGVAQVDLDAAELLRAQRDPGAGDPVAGRGADGEADGLDGLLERYAGGARRRGGRGDGGRGGRGGRRGARGGGGCGRR